ncbi:hypothetical protein E2I00_017078 [Balaenoptera physalus]|uniref:Proton-coupled zinc antiporter SLC30A8 n=1 Tax=Balaenoptera physalus TaxID=9770 RepID=A0A6A1Q747_BALPH|nr:hypothetical protein E2I00_017078 [Balaenoptera physalus]
MELQQKPLNKDQRPGEKPEEPESGAMYHCHSNSKATENRAKEQVYAKWKLCAASGTCLVFMIAEVIEILGALLSILCVWAVTGVLVYLACERLLYSNYQIQATVMIIVSSCAVAVNIILSVILHQRHPGHNHKEVQANASVRAASVHALGDLFQSISVLISALIIYFKPDYKMADPICTFVFSILVLASTITILKDFSILLMEGVPKNLSYSGVKELILAVDGVVSVHSLHVWSLTMNQVILSAHVTAGQRQKLQMRRHPCVYNQCQSHCGSLSTAASRDSQVVRREIAKALSSSFPVHSLTIQMEPLADQDPDCLFCEDPRD